MALGYMIRMGDKTSCGGRVLDGHRLFKIDGAARSTIALGAASFAAGTGGSKLGEGIEELINELTE